MTFRGKVSPFRTMTLAALLAAGIVIPALPAHAVTEPPFAVGFPQDTQPTIFSSTFGASRSGGRRHQGNDLMAPKLTQVYAAADGIITVIDTASGAGRYVEIQHQSGWSTRYMHLNNDDPGTDNGSADWSLTVVLGLAVGSHVTAGQHIGYVGDSGNAEWTGSHTHFELAYEGRSVDPYPFLKEAYAKAEALRSVAARGAMRYGDTKLS
jgi:murein DD-endopeptidase MepM/ murein hydrolase activator NlpD